MKFQLHPLAARTLTTTLCGAVLVACGGGNAPQDSTLSSNAGASISTAGTIYSGRSVTSTAPTTSPTATPSTTAPTTSGTAITNVRLENTAAAAQSNVPVTFGQVFAAGHLAKGVALVGRLEDGSTLPLQVDVKASHPDGSVRHAVLSGVIPSLAAGQTRTMELLRGSASTTAAAATSALLNSGFTASATASIGGVRYQASADQLIKSGKFSTWLAGPTVSEWQVSAPLKTAAGAVHPHLTARFAVRWYGAAQRARVDVTIENNWAYEPAPQNFTYDAEIMVGGKVVYAKPAMTHLHHARWRKLFWWGGANPEVHVKHNTGYLIASRAVPNYDQSIVVPETQLAAIKTKWTGTRIEPMGVGLANPYMPSTGGREDIGLLPGWAVNYLLSMDKRAKEATLGTADLAGSWSIHYRDKLTDRPISVLDYPYMTLIGRPGDAVNPATKKSEAFPACATTTACTTPNSHDSAHQPGFAFLPYLVTGDYYYLEELQFWAMMNSFASNPYYRQFNKGLYQSDQVRGQAWSMRTIAQVAYITPDADPLKSHFNSILTSNLDWYNSTYTNNTSANKLGVLVNGHALVYNNGTGVAPWMDDFFTAAVGHAGELGFTKATPLLQWKSKFTIDRMIAPGACWIDGTIYSMVVKDASGNIAGTMDQAYKLSHTAEFNALQCNSTAMATALKLKVGEMTGYSTSTVGYPSNMQPALAFSVGANPTAGKQAWSVFMSRSVKPNYAMGPQFAIIPR